LARTADVRLLTLKDFRSQKYLKKELQKDFEDGPMTLRQTNIKNISLNGPLVNHVPFLDLRSCSFHLVQKTIAYGKPAFLLNFVAI
jgi:hypothetical protein